MQKNNNKPGYKETKVGWIPRDWECVPFTEIFDRVVMPLSPVESKPYREIGVRSHGKGVFHKEPVTGADLGSKRVFHCQPGALVFNIVFAWEQAVAVLSERERGFIASHRFPMYEGKNAQAFEPFFLSFFKTRRGKDGLSIASPGGAGRNKTLGQREMDYLYVPKPSGPEQEAIAEVLECWDKAIRGYGRKIEKKRNIKKGLMQQLLSGKRRLPGFGVELGIENSECGIPEGWKEVRLGECVSIEYGKDWKEVREPSGRFVVYGTGGPMGHARSALFEPPAILLGRKGTIDSPFFINDPFWAVDTTFVMRAVSDIDLVFLHNKLLTIHWQQYNEASGVPSLSRETIRAIPLCIPSETSEQRAIAAILSTADAEISALERKLAVLREQKRFLLNNMVTGTIRLPAYRIENLEWGIRN